MSHRKRSGQVVVADINVTPLVDVCLVLLVIFMVVAPLLSRHGNVSPPSTSRPSPLAHVPAPLTLALEADGTAWLGERRVPAGDLAAALETRLRADGQRAVLLVADRRLRFGDVRPVLLRVRSAGYSGASLATRRSIER